MYDLQLLTEFELKTTLTITSSCTQIQIRLVILSMTWTPQNILTGGMHTMSQQTVYAAWVMTSPMTSPNKYS